jgi:flagellar hook-length control protein FliK
LLARASAAESTDDRDAVAATGNSKSAAKDQRVAARPASRKKTASDDEPQSRESEKAIASGQSKSSGAALKHHDGISDTSNDNAGEEDASTPSGQLTTVAVSAVTAEKRSIEPRATVTFADGVQEAVLADVALKGATHGPGKKGAPPQSGDEAPGPASAKDALSGIVESAVDDLVEESSDASILPGKSGTAAAPAGAPMVKSASWVAAAAALREALQKSALSTPDSQARSQPASTAATGAQDVTSSGPAVDMSVAGSVVPPAPSRSQREANAAQAQPTDSAGTFGDSAAATVAAALTMGARQESSGSHSDLGNDSTQGYKAPVKNSTVLSTYAAPAAFARALESAAPEATAALPQPFSASHLSTVGPQLVKGLQMQVTAGGGDMRLTLTPEHLGTVSIEVRVEHDRVKATLMADTAAVRQWIATHQDDLRERLDAAGLKLDDLVVKEDGRQDRQQPQDDRPAPRKRRASRGDAEQQFEVIA